MRWITSLACSFCFLLTYSPLVYGQEQEKKDIYDIQTHIGRDVPVGEANQDGQIVYANELNEQQTQAKTSSVASIIMVGSLLMMITSFAYFRLRKSR